MQGRGYLGAVRKPSPASALLTGLLESSPAACEVADPQEKVGSVFWLVSLTVHPTPSFPELPPLSSPPTF